ncbi:MAG: sulfotransferase [Fuerstiella sp.]
MSRVAPSANFRDPVGLLLRMLKSRNRAAYGALFREGLRLGAMPFDRVLKHFEARTLSASSESPHPQVLIVGAPRSGTTLVYQALAHYLNVTSPSNLSAMFLQAPLTAARLHSCLPSFSKPDFRNFYGQTTRLSGPNDAFHLWDRWLGDDRYHPAESLSEDTVADMRRFLNAWTLAFDRPFLNKNNRNTSCISLLARHLPAARFVVVRRNPLYVAQSLIRAREQVQGDKSVGWGLQSSTSDDSADPLGYVDDVCQQIMSIDRDMEQQLDHVSADRVIRVTYEGFCEHPQETICNIALAFDGVELNPNAALHELTPFESSRPLTLSSEEAARIRARLQPSSDPAAAVSRC